MRLLLVLGLGLLGVVTPVSGQGKPSPALEKLAAEFVAAFNAKDAAKVAALFAEDGMLLPPDVPLIKGRPEIERFYKKLFETNVGTLKLTSLEADTSGSTGFDVGTYTRSVSGAGNLLLLGVGGGSRVIAAGKYLTIVKRIGPDWTIAYTMSNLDQQPPK